MKWPWHKKSTEPDKKNRITNDTIEEHRREALDRGKRFKYPLQYEKHKVVLNAVFIGLTVVALLGLGLWWSLYKAQSENVLLYKITRFLPLPAGRIDHTNIRYSDYLAQYRVSLHYYQTKEVTADNRQSIPDEVKQEFRSQALDNATLIALARQIAAEKGVAVSDQEEADDLAQKRTVNGEQMSIAEFDRVIEDYYGLSSSEYQTTFITNPLLIRKVSVAIDQKAASLAKTIEQKIAKDDALDLALLAEQHQDDVEVFESGLVRINNSDGGRSTVAASLSPGQISKPFVLGDSTGYCFIKLLSRDENGNINYQSLTVKFKELSHRLKVLRESHKVKYYIRAGKEENNV